MTKRVTKCEVPACNDDAQHCHYHGHDLCEKHIDVLWNSDLTSWEALDNLLKPAGN